MIPPRVFFFFYGKGGKEPDVSDGKRLLPLIDTRMTPIP